MKRKSLLFLLLIAFALPWAAQAQEETLIVHDGTATNEYVPFYGYWADATQQNQMIYPATELADMEGGTISGMTFYWTPGVNYNFGYGVGTWTISIGETTATSLSGLDNATSLTQVFTGDLDALFNSDDQTLSIAFDSPYTYSGGNLLVQFSHSVADSYRDYAFYGENVTGASYCYNDQRNFLPKTTFTYTPDVSGCPKPRKLAANNVTGRSAVITWEGLTEYYFVWRYKKASATNWQHNGSTGGLTYTMTGLDPETEYIFAVATLCDTGESDYREITFTTEEACPTPTNLTVGTIGSRSVELSWTENGEASQWEIYSDCDDEEAWTNVSSNPYTLTRLMPSTHYTVKVRANCDGDNGDSQWSNIVSFTTDIACPAPTNLTVAPTSVNAHGATATWNGTSNSYVVMIGESEIEMGTEGFEGQTIPAFFTNDATRPWTVTAGGANDSGYCIIPGNKGVDSSESDLTCVVTGPCTVSFMARVSSENNWDWGRFLIDDAQQFQISGTQDWTEYSYDLTEGTHTLIWRYYKDGSSSGGNDLFYVDNITVPMPVVNSWTEYTTTAQTYTFDNLDPETPYQVKVKGNCGYYGYSEETAPVSFTTLANCPVPTNLNVAANSITAHEATLTWVADNDSYNIMLGEASYLVTADFETGDFSQADFTNGSYAWSVVANDHSGAYCAKSATGYHGQTSALELTVTLENDETLTFSAKVSSEPDWDKAYFYIDNEAKINGISGAGDWIDYSFPLTAGTHTLSWQYTKDGSVSNNNDCFYVDDIVITNGTGAGVLGNYTSTTTTYNFTGLAAETTYTVQVQGVCDGEPTAWSEAYSFTTAIACYAPTNLVADTIEAHSVLLSWTETGDATEWQICVNNDETNLITATTHVGFNLTGLSAETDYTVKVRANCGGEDGDSRWSNVVSFTTDIACPVPANVTASGITSNSADISWESDAANYNLRYKQVGRSSTATVTLTVVGDIWGDGSGYQMVLDADATMFSIISNDYTNFNYYGGYSEFEYLIPENATHDPDGAIVFDESVSITIPAGTYDWFVLNPVPDDAVYIAAAGCENGYGNVMGGQDNYVFEAGKTYEFVVSYDSELDYDRVDVTITDTPGAGSEWTEVNNATSPYTISPLNDGQMYELQVQAVCGGEDGESEWTSSVTFTTPQVCPVPTDVTVSNIEHYTATVNWNGETPGYNLFLGHNEVAETYVSENFEQEVIPSSWNNDSDHPWIIAEGNGGFIMKNGNNGIDSSTSEISFTYTLTENAKIEFDALCHGEGTSTYWDHCDFYIDNTRELYAGEQISGWNHYSFDVTPGTHTFKWSYTKDNSMSTVGETFSVDNVNLVKISQVWNAPVAVNTNAYELTDLEPGIEYLVKVGPDCNETISSEVVSFTTRSADDKIFAVEGDWGTASNWIPAGVPTIDQTVELRANATITGVAEAASITGTTGNNAYTLTIEDGSKLRHNNTGVVATVKKTINAWTVAGSDTEDPNGYYLISNPLTGGVTPSAENGILAGNYDLYKFDFMQDLEWQNYEASTFSLNSGAYGYLYANEQGTELIYNGTINAYIGNKSRSTGSSSYGTYEFNGWYLLGNPYMYDAYVADYSSNGNALPYVKMNETGDGFVNVAAGTPVEPMEGFFCQSENATYTYVVTYVPNIPNEGKLNMNLRKDNKQLDNAILVFGGEQQLGKFSFREGSSKIYMPVEGKDLAITSVEGQVGEMPISFEAEKNGTYSLNFTSQEVSFSYLHLIDNMTGADVDLLETPSYTFNATTSDYASRFRLVFATGSSVSNDSFSFINASGNLCIFGIEGKATVQVIDVMGHVLSSETFSGSYEKRINAAPGVYMIRLIQGNDVKVQKVVVK